MPNKADTLQGAAAILLERASRDAQRAERAKAELFSGKSFARPEIAIALIRELQDSAGFFANLSEQVRLAAHSDESGSAEAFEVEFDRALFGAAHADADAGAD